jgi:hypothetical protein
MFFKGIMEGGPGPIHKTLRQKRLPQEKKRVDIYNRVFSPKKPPFLFDFFVLKIKVV